MYALSKLWKLFKGLLQHTSLWVKVAMTCPIAVSSDIEKQQKLAVAVVLCLTGIIVYIGLVFLARGTMYRVPRSSTDLSR